LINAYLFINLSSEREDVDLLDPIKEIREVIEAYRVYGTYDIVILIEAENAVSLKDITLKSVRKLGFVHSTMTLISLQSYYNK